MDRPSRRHESAPAVPGTHAFVRYSHPTDGFSLPVPPTWEVTESPGPGISVVLCAPTAADSFRTNMLLTLDTLDPGMTLRDWQIGTERLLPATLVDYMLIDLEHVEIGALPGVRRLAQHRSGAHAVTMEQWATVKERTGYTLTASAATLDYPAVSGYFSATSAGLSFHDGPSGTA